MLIIGANREARRRIEAELRMNLTLNIAYRAQR